MSILCRSLLSYANLLVTGTSDESISYRNSSHHYSFPSSQLPFPTPSPLRSFWDSPSFPCVSSLSVSQFRSPSNNSLDMNSGKKQGSKLCIDVYPFSPTLLDRNLNLKRMKHLLIPPLHRLALSFPVPISSSKDSSFESFRKLKIGSSLSELQCSSLVYRSPYSISLYYREPPLLLPFAFPLTLRD